MAIQVQAMQRLKAGVRLCSRTANNLRVQAEAAGVHDAFTIDGFAERYLRPLFLPGNRAVSLVALSGERADLAELDRLVVEMSFRPRWGRGFRSRGVT